MKKVIVIGGGAGGLFAAIKAREMGASVTILEKNNILGKKLLITGKGRCNLTNSGSLDDFINKINNGQFLYSAVNKFSNKETIDFFHSLGLPTKVERGGRVFPKSDRARDVVNTLEKYLHKIGVSVKFNTHVDSLTLSEGKIKGVSASRIFYSGDAVILATGGASYPGTGCTGDGYKMAMEVGHTIIPLKPSLVPLETAQSWVKEIQGLSLKNVEVTAWAGPKKLGSGFGEMLFTHFGLSGPVILSLSKYITDYLSNRQKDPVTIKINLKPALSPEQLDSRLQRDFQKFARKQLRNAFAELLPKSLIPVFVSLLPIPEDKPVHQITRGEREKIVQHFREFSLTVTKPRPLAEAIVTSGGVSIKEVNPKSMESKLVKDLFFAGEILDFDGLTGGYNLQAAFSTGYTAGLSAAE